MALFYERTAKYAQWVLDTADIVRDGDLSTIIPPRRIVGRYFGVALYREPSSCEGQAQGVRFRSKTEVWRTCDMPFRTMTDSEKWKELCAKAAVEQDPQRLLELVQQINEIFEQLEMEKKRQAERKSH